MKRDEAIEAIRAVRHAISAEHGHDTRRLIRHYQQMEKQYANRIFREDRCTRTPSAAGTPGRS